MLSRFGKFFVFDGGGFFGGGEDRLTRRNRWEATKNEFGAITCVDAPEKKREVLDAPEKMKREEFKA